MYIKRLKASFGRLQGDELILHEGLNIIQAPNESGKSTWSHFIRTMLYGISTSERSKNGSVPDKARFRPWGSQPMQGQMDIVWQGKDITLTRPAVGGDKPMGGCIATYTGTGEKISELMGKNTGEALLGITEAVFRRSAFITFAEIPVDKDNELEKKITSLVTSGEEECSYTDADERLRRWQRKRRFRSEGRLPEAEKRLNEVRQALKNIEDESSRLADLREKIKKLEKQKELLELELRRHVRDERLEAVNRLNEAERTYSAIQVKKAVLEKEINGVREEDLKSLEAESSRLAIHKKTYADAADELKKEERELSSLPDTAVKGLGGKGGAALASFALALACFAVTLAISIWLILIPAAVLCITGGLLLFLRARDLAEKRAEFKAARELLEYKVRLAKDRYEASMAEVQKSETAQAQLMKKLNASDGETPDSLASRLYAAIAAYGKACIEADSELNKVELLKGMVTGEAEDIEGETRLSKSEAETYMKQTVSELEKTERELARGEGTYSRLGDPLLLSTEENRLKEEILSLEREYRALDLAIYTMRDANSRLQALFSPLISREAGMLLSAMTSGVYKGVYFDRDMRFSAERAEDISARELEYLSDGTKNQLYLAIRLAICRLALPSPPEGEMCPLILDDALDSFDDERAMQALKLLNELSGERQIILFTCHSREKSMLEKIMQ
jgi:uncharacterized protein YhaN